MKDIKPRMTSVNIDSRMVKKILEWRIRGLTIVLSLGIVIGFMVAYVDNLKAIDISSTLTISSTSSLSETEIFTYTYSLSPTTATPDFPINLRSGPSESYGRKSGLWQTSQVTVLGTDSLDCEWVYVTVMPANAFGGWAFSAYLRDDEKKLVSEKCSSLFQTDAIYDIPKTQKLDPDDSLGEQYGSFFQRYQMLAIGIIALLLTALLYWIAYTKGFLSRLRQPESSAGIPANSKIPKAGTPYLEAMLISAQPIYCPLNGKNISIGRNKENTLVIDSRFAQWDTVSSQHARIEQDGDSFIITDLDSKNGVFVDGRRTQENILYDGMQVSLGKVAFVFRVNGK